MDRSERGRVSALVRDSPCESRPRAANTFLVSQNRMPLIVPWSCIQGDNPISGKKNKKNKKKVIFTNNFDYTMRRIYEKKKKKKHTQSYLISQSGTQLNPISFKIIILDCSIYFFCIGLVYSLADPSSISLLALTCDDATCDAVACRHLPLRNVTLS